MIRGAVRCIQLHASPATELHRPYHCAGSLEGHRSEMTVALRSGIAFPN
jgi:hypothetical protein